jgi:tRNA(Arg) A34 adenosine deaminase TadA
MSIEEIHLNYLRKCLSIAENSVTNGNHPFGALIVLDDKIVVSSGNQVVSLDDVTSHAELLLVQRAQAILDSEELTRSTLYTSTEPCPMCSGAIYWSGIKKVVFGCSTDELFKIVQSGLNVSSEYIFKKGTREIELTGYPEEEMFKEVHRQFWKGGYEC